MLIQYSIKNFKTFKDRATLNLLATNHDKTREIENVSSSNNYNLRVLKSAVVFGANASGKSKFIEALMFMKHFVINSFSNGQKGDKIFVDPFRLNTESENEPCEFEVIFIYESILFRYGFEANKKQIIAEWLYYKPKIKEVELFYRSLQNVEMHSRSFKNGVITVTNQLIRENALLISLASQINEDFATKVILWFKSLSVISGVQEHEYLENSTEKINTSFGKSKILTLLNSADLEIEDIINKKNRFNELNNSDILVKKLKFSNKLKFEQVEFNLNIDESEGTKKYFYLIGFIVDSLDNGSCLFIDELDSKLHPNLVCKIISLFNSKKLNPKNAQLIFNTHDSNLLSSGLFRKDQVWFTEKNIYGEAKLYSLADFNSGEVRKKESFEENYLRGKYGAIPYLGFFDDLVESNLLQNDEI